MPGFPGYSSPDYNQFIIYCTGCGARTVHRGSGTTVHLVRKGSREGEREATNCKLTPNLVLNGIFFFSLFSYLQKICFMKSSIHLTIFHNKDTHNTSLYFAVQVFNIHNFYFSAMSCMKKFISNVDQR